jgi:SAM-dependent methyltransferase
VSNKVKLDCSIPEMFDAEFGIFDRNINFYLNFIDEGSVLDLSCGTGRSVIPLSRYGLDCVGLDSSAAMLDYARHKVQGFPAEFILGDMRFFDLQREFDLIILSGNSFQALSDLAEQKRVLACVRAHLSHQGVFVLQMRNMTKDLQRDQESYSFWHSFKDNYGRTMKVYGRHTFDSVSSAVTYSIKRSCGGDDTFSELRLLLMTGEELELFMCDQGFEIVHLYSDYQKTPYFKECETIIAVCRLS